MSELEMTLLCAEAMGYTGNLSVSLSGGLSGQAAPCPPLASLDNGRPILYDPLHDDAQAMALVKKLKLHIDQRPGRQISVQDPHFEQMVLVDGILITHKNALNRAIVECVANMNRRAHLPCRAGRSRPLAHPMSYPTQ